MFYVYKIPSVKSRKLAKVEKRYIAAEYSLVEPDPGSARL